jgi:tetratricopeptide (TPR) repeat protein/predicted Ser/Thr protein kinase
MRSDAVEETETLSTLGPTMLAGSRPAPVSGDISRGASIGRYLVLAKLGAGGMGVVLAAYDPELDRKIALKLLKTQGQSSARTRLQREAQALAKLDHRNVVSVYDVGVHEGQLFVAMEFVAGKTLGAWMAEVEQPRPWKEVLRVFAEAGRGLVAAHEAGLMHRDFKPDNVMLGDDGRVRVMDFGLARADESEVADEPMDVTWSLERTTGKQLLVSPLTQTGTMLGTPAYMSPEQFEGKAADARTDQFGFCVSLYEALYGTRPFVGKNLPELFQAVSRGDVEPAPKDVAVPMWLRAIVVRGLAPEPEKRWPSMRALLEALADDPAVRRRKWFAIASVVGLLGGGAWGLVHAVQADAQVCKGFDERLARVWDEDRRAEVRAAIEGTGLSYAPGTWTRVEQRLDEYTQQWVTAREQACEATHSGEQSEALLDLRMECLDERLQHVRAMVEVLAEADETVVKGAVIAVTSLPRLERCADVDALTAQIPPPEDPEVAARVPVLDEQLVKAQALKVAGKYADGLVLADAVVAEAALLGYEPLLTRAWLCQADLQDLAGKYDLAEVTLEQAYESAVAQQMVAEATSALVHLIAIVGYDLARHEDGRRWAKYANPFVRAASTDEVRAHYLNNLGMIAWGEDKHEEARGYHEGALAMHEKALGSEHPRVATSLNNLGTVAYEEGKYDEARGYYARALTIYEKALGPEHPNVAPSLVNLGLVAETEGKYDEARSYYERALAIRERALGPEHPDLAISLYNLGSVADEEGKYDEARSYVERARAIDEKALGPEHPDVALTLYSLGGLAYEEGKYDEARGYVERALAIYEKALGPEHPDVAMSLDALSLVAEEEGKYAKARVYQERALAIRQKALGPEHPDVAGSFNNLGVVAASEGKYEEARGHYGRALTILETALGPQHPHVATCLNSLGDVAYLEGKYEEARDHQERALAIYEKALGPEHPDLASALLGLGQALLGRAKPAEALPHLERAASIRTANPGDPTELAAIHLALARALWDAPTNQGRDRPRAHTLAEQARSAYEAAGEQSAKELQVVQAWQAKHRE